MTPLEIENAVIAVLDAAPQKKYFNVARYDGRAADINELAEWIATVQLPCVAVFYGGTPSYTAENERKTVLFAEVLIEIWVIHDKLRGYESTMVAPDGIYGMLEFLKDSLVGKVLEDGMLPMVIESDGKQILDEGSGRMVWGQIWKSGYRKSYQN